jgi:hypothetical protein
MYSYITMKNMVCVILVLKNLNIYVLEQLKVKNSQKRAKTKKYEN